MKNSVKILLKLCLFTYLLFLTPFFSALPTFLGLDESFITSNVYQHDFVEQISIKDQLNLLKVGEGVMLSNPTNKVEISSGSFVDNSIKKETENNTVVPNINLTGKKVYIYNTHQQEAYQDNKSVIDASVELANQLQASGVQVVYESNDFSAYLKNNNLDYNSSYAASYFYLNEALVNYGGFDLVIDFHRDSVPRESAFSVINDKSYAKMMFVVGQLSSNYESVNTLSNDLTNKVNEILAGVIKTPMVREAYYNQQVYKNSVLIEVGSDTNTFEEIKNSTNLLAQAIIKYLG